MTALAPRPRPTPTPHRRAEVDVYTGGDPIAALRAAADVYEVAGGKGLPYPVGPAEVDGDRIVVRLPWPHLLLWFDILDGFGPVDVEDGYVDGDDLKDPENDHYERGIHRVQVVPYHRHGNFAVYGWTWDDSGGRRSPRQKKQWVLRPLTEEDCQSCDDLPEPARQPLSVEGWAAQQRFEIKQFWAEKQHEIEQFWHEQGGREPVTGPIPAVTA